MKKFIFYLLITAFIISCTDNQEAKSYGGHASITLPPNQKLLNVTWKDDDLWYVTKPMNASDSPEVYTFQEKSSFGVWQGSYTITEIKQ